MVSDVIGDIRGASTESLSLLLKDCDRYLRENRHSAKRRTITLFRNAISDELTRRRRRLTIERGLVWAGMLMLLVIFWVSVVRAIFVR